MRPRQRALLLFWAGILLLLSSVLVPATTPHRHQFAYEAERVEYGNPTIDGPFGSPLVDLQDCRVGYAGECIWARRVDGNGTVRIPVTTPPDTGPNLYGYSDYVRLDTGYARSNASFSGGALVVRFHPVPAKWVFRNASLSYENAPEPVRRAISKGSTTATYRTWGSDVDRPDLVEYVQRRGVVYRVRRLPVEHAPILPQWLYDLSRICGFAGGLAALYVGRGRHARILASGR